MEYSFVEKLGLSYQIAKAQFKVKNEGSYLGVLWYLLNPILLFSLLFLIFSQRLGQDIVLYPIYLIIGIVMFNFFQAVTIESTKIIIENSWLIKSINFPRESLIAGIVLKSLFSHLFEILIIAVILFYYHTPIYGLLFYLIILFFFLLFVFGCSLILSSLTVYFIDLENIWNFATRLLWFGTPIFYSIAGQTKLFYLNLFNPLYYFISVARDMLILGSAPFWQWLGIIGFSIVFLVLGLIIFNKLKKRFAELI